MRSNYASLDCGASVVYSHSAQNPKDALNPDRDSYLLFECSAPEKVIHVQLCQDILVDSLLIGNYELFSSSFKQIKVYATDRYTHDTTNWQLLGQFSGSDKRTEQMFTIDDPHIWASHLRIDFASHWGHEFYCPVNTIAVYGTTMLDKSKNILTPGHEPEGCANIHIQEQLCEDDSPLSNKQCCAAEQVGASQGSVYEVILDRIQALEQREKLNAAYVEAMNATFIHETHQLQETLHTTVEQLKFHQRTVVLETLLLVIVVGYGLLQALSRYHDQTFDTDAYARTWSAPFQADEQLPQSPPLFTPGTSAIPSPPAEREDAVIRNKEIKATVARLLSETCGDDSMEADTTAT